MRANPRIYIVVFLLLLSTESAYSADFHCVDGSGQEIYISDSSLCGNKKNKKVVSPSPLTGNNSNYGTYLKPFSARSPWNSRPHIYTLGGDVIPPDAYEAAIASGSFSTSFFTASASDAPVTIYGVYDQDSEMVRDLVLPHWPDNVSSANGSDGHIDVLDTTTGIIHSFWIARLNDGKWSAKLYAWSRIDDSGFGDPAHYYKGARAAAVPTSAGIIRVNEIDDGKDQYDHALAMSLTYSALSPVPPGYIYPATSADSSYQANRGTIPEGALMMLPSNFDLSKIASSAIRKIAKTLMSYGAYVVDRNTGTPFVIYQEIGTAPIAQWRQSADTRLIRTALRQATVSEYLDANGIPYAPTTKQNILSMRGIYQLQMGKVKSTYDTYNQKRTWSKTSEVSREFIYPFSKVEWSKPVAGDTYEVVANTEGGAKLELQVKGDQNFDSGPLKDGESKTFQWPEEGHMVIIIYSGIAESSSVSGTLIKK
ncbi:hypothetical protein ZMTM_05110 [Methyloradius palustris]|uniref:Uncharacterized protein n=2 Tax=Methyloradius palustris TaxID=2778876 RepID=A0A8D5JY04_9PROT|nr:hypothetical protein ZMTM_05110 [Methyloradius palustris]